MATLDEVLSQMAAADMPPLPAGHPRVGTEKPVRFGPLKKCWYWINEYQARNGKRYFAGAFGRWQGTDNGRITIKSDWSGVEPDELQRVQRTQAAAELKDRAKREARARFAGNRALQQWNAGRARLGEGEAVPPYLAKKRLQWENGLRVFTDGTLLVPGVRYDITEEQDADQAYTGPRRLAGLQKITPDGAKLFNKGMDPRGVACRFGRKPKDGDLLFIGEGLATVLSVHQGLERAYTCYVAFVAGNLERIARMLRQQFPKSPIVFLADDDAYLVAQLVKRLRTDYGVAGEIPKYLDVDRELDSKYGKITVRADIHAEQGGTEVLTAGITVGERLRTIVLQNTGRTKARAAAVAVGNAHVVFPVFSERILSNDPEAPRLTDFNDLHIAEGIGKVVLQVGDEIQRVRDSVELAKAIAAGVAPGGGEELAGGGKGRGGGGDGDSTDWRLHWSLLSRFTQIYPSDTAYDAEKGRVVKVEHMRLRFGTKPVGMWLASSKKRVIDPAQLVFDPTNTSGPDTVNLFRGLPEQPRDGGSCALLLDLIHYLCGESPEDTEIPKTTWLLRWLAYPLQHLGAKMQTAIVMHGEEGTGKNLVFGTVRKMYGRHGGVITQRQLEDKFNTWQSAKLFVVANEVVTRQEMTHQSGFIRNLITEPEIQINPKFQDQREEANHMNIVFLANALQPLLLGLNDRRCLVLRTPNPRDEAFYKQVGAEVKAGGVAAFYRHLMALELGDFNEHTKPPMTDAKRALIELGMSTPQLFWMELKEGLLGLPYTPALSTDLYKAYCVWCARNGYKMPEGMKFFSPNFMSMNGVRRVDRHVPMPGRMGDTALIGTDKESQLRKRRVFLMGKPEVDEVAEKNRVARGVAEFRSRLHEYLREESVDSGQAGHGQGEHQRGGAF